VAEVKVREYIASLKAELEFYKEEYQKYKSEELNYEELREDLESYKEKNKKLVEEIDWLKAMINEQKEQEKKAQSKIEAKAKEAVKPKEPAKQKEVVNAHPSFDKTIDQGLSELQQKLSGVQRHKMRQQSVSREREISNQDLFLKLQRKMDK
jgi:chromosome segregation ATPase